MSSSQKLSLDMDQSKIAAVRNAWIQAVRDGDAIRLTDLVTDDFVGIHRDGSCVRGKSELRKDILDQFALFDAEPTVSSSEVIVHGKWAVETDELEATRSPIGINMMPVHANFRIVVVFARQPDTSWRVARVIELFD